MSLLNKLKKKDKNVERAKDDKEKEEGVKDKNIILPKGKDPYTYQIIKSIHLTEKATFLSKQNQYVFQIYPKANKSEVKKTIEKLFNVKVERVRIVKNFGKRRQIGLTIGWKPGIKKAIVKLKDGYKIDLIQQ